MRFLPSVIATFATLILLSGCSIMKVSSSSSGHIGRELLDLHEARDKQIISEAEYQRLKNRLLEATENSNDQTTEGNDEKMVHVIAFITVKPEHREELIKIFNANVPNVLAEDGCIQYTLTTDTDSDIDIQTKDENVLTVIEKWESKEALQAHLAAPHMDQYRTDTEGMTDGLDLRVLKDS